MVIMLLVGAVPKGDRLMGQSQMQHPKAFEATLKSGLEGFFAFTITLIWGSINHEMTFGAASFSNGLQRLSALVSDTDTFRRAHSKGEYA